MDLHGFIVKIKHLQAENWAKTIFSAAFFFPWPKIKWWQPKKEKFPAPIFFPDSKIVYHARKTKSNTKELLGIFFYRKFNYFQIRASRMCIYWNRTRYKNKRANLTQNFRNFKIRSYYGCVAINCRYVLIVDSKWRICAAT